MGKDCIAFIELVNNFETENTKQKRVIFRFEVNILADFYKVIAFKSSCLSAIASLMDYL
jgi:hypothetical protein